ncbi:MAG: NRDE family protein [bacterium]
MTEGFFICFVAGWLKTGDSSELTIASNRDEFVDRQGQPPELWSDGSHRVLSPRDPRKGGTWIGVNEEGVFAALTNKLDSDYLEDAPSRGQLIRSLLEEAGNREEANTLYDELDPSRFNPFWLLVADSRGLTIKHHGRDLDEQFVHQGGPFFLSNQSGFINEEDRLISVLPDIGPLEAAEKTDRLEAFCASHQPLFERDSHCLHADIAGTLSSSIIRLNTDGEFSYRFSQGPPCENDYQSIEVPVSFRREVISKWDREDAKV